MSIMTVDKATTVRTMPQLIKAVNVLYEKAKTAEDKAAQYWTALGIELKEAKARNKESGDLSWVEFAKLHFNFGQSRADEFIRIADGKTTVEEVRDGNTKRSIERREANQALRNAEAKREAKLVPEDNMLHVLSGMNENARIFNKFFKISAFEREAANRIVLAIDKTIGKLRLVKSTLQKKKADIWSAENHGAANKDLIAFANQSLEFIQDFNHRFQVWELTKPDLGEEENDALTAAIQFCADGMSRIAQGRR